MEKRPPGCGRLDPVAVNSTHGGHLATASSSARREAHRAHDRGDAVRVHAAGRPPATRLLGCVVGLTVLIGTVGGVWFWCWTQVASVLELHPMSLPVGDAAHAMWRLVVHGGRDGSFIGGCAAGGPALRWARTSTPWRAAPSTGAGCASAPGRHPQTYGGYGFPNPSRAAPTWASSGRGEGGCSRPRSRCNRW